MKTLVFLMSRYDIDHQYLVEEYIKKGFWCINKNTLKFEHSNYDFVYSMFKSFKERCNENTEKILIDCKLNSSFRKTIINLAKANKYRIEVCYLESDFFDSQMLLFDKMFYHYRTFYFDSTSILALNKSEIFTFKNLKKEYKLFDPPSIEEGFDEIWKIKYNYKLPENYKNTAFIINYDLLDDYLSVRKSKSSKLDFNRIMKQPYRHRFAIYNNGIENLEIKDIESIKYLYRSFFDKISFCTHRENCYCKLPNIGLLVELIHYYSINPKDSIVISDDKNLRDISSRIGFKTSTQEGFIK